jgi:hypothetical protein
MVSNGPSKNITDGHPAFLTRDSTLASDGPVLPVDQLVDDLEWAQYNWQVTLPMALNGPSICHNGYYRISSTDGLRWVQC